MEGEEGKSETHIIRKIIYIDLIESYSIFFFKFYFVFTHYQFLQAFRLVILVKIIV